MPFECKAGNVTECQCSGIDLDGAAKDYIAGSYADCLCRRCLLEIKQAQRPARPEEKPMNALPDTDGGNRSGAG